MAVCGRSLCREATAPGVGVVLGSVVWLIAGRGGTMLMTVPAAAPLLQTAIAVAVSVGIGLVFGVMPARRAARLDPIEALRYE